MANNKKDNPTLNVVYFTGTFQSYKTLVEESAEDETRLVDMDIYKTLQNVSVKISSSGEPQIVFGSGSKTMVKTLTEKYESVEDLENIEHYYVITYKMDNGEHLDVYLDSLNYSGNAAGFVKGAALKEQNKVLDIMSISEATQYYDYDSQPDTVKQLILEQQVDGYWDYSGDGVYDATKYAPKLNKAYDKLYNRVNKNNRFQYFVSFSIGDVNIKSFNRPTSGFNKETVSTSFQYTRGTDGNANTFTFIVSFNASNNTADKKYDKALNPNDLEYELIRATTLSTTTDDGEDVIEFMKGRLQFGYIWDNNTTMKSPVYKFYITDYTVEFQRGFLVYNITGVSSSAYTLALKFKRKGYKSYRHPTRAAVLSLKANLEDNAQVLVGTFDDGTSILDSDATFGEIASKRNEDGEWETSEDNFPDGSAISDLLTNVNELLGCAVLQEDFDRTLESAKANEDTQLNISNYRTGTYKVIHIDSHKDDETGKEYPLGKVAVIFQSNSSTTTAAKLKSIKDENLQVFSFDWGDLTNNSGYVQDFRIDMQGSVNNAIGIDFTDEYALYYLDEEGNKVGINSDFLTANNNDAIFSKFIRDTVAYEKLSNIAYTATLTTLGMPKEVPLLSIIKISVVYNGIPHYASGYYQVTGVTDTMDSSGFVTMYKLLKITEKVSVDVILNALNLGIKDKLSKTKYSNTTFGFFEDNVYRPAEYYDNERKQQEINEKLSPEHVAHVRAVWRGNEAAGQIFKENRQIDTIWKTVTPNVVYKRDPYVTVAIKKVLNSQTNYSVNAIQDTINEINNLKNK